MPRKYIKKVGPAGNRNYDLVYLERAVRAVKSGRMTIRGASEQFAVPYTTLRRWVKTPTLLEYGGQTALTEADERRLSEGLLTCANWGFPQQPRDVKNIVQSYFDRQGRIVKQFKNNCPGREWVKNFLKRHPELTVKMSENIKRVRASVTRETLQEYFANLESTLKDVPASQIINYDETNFTDDPGNVKVIVKRGVKHADRIMDTSKTSVSVMVAAAADGTLLPPYVLYKAKYVYPGWIEGGVAGSEYNSNSSGWFDSVIFGDWFQKIILPYIRRLPRDTPKIILGDNLSSHLTLSVIEECTRHNVRFTLLPPNSTHLCQPLDVAYFRPLKGAWRNVLEEWKKRNRGVVPKTEFPRLLKKAFETVGANNAKNITAGFQACGIFPYNPERVLQKIPRQTHIEEDDEIAERSWTDSFVDQLKDLRQGSSETQKRPRGKRINIQAGKSIVPSDIAGKLSNEIDEDVVSNNNVTNVINGKGKETPPEDHDSDNWSNYSLEFNENSMEENEVDEVFKENDFVLTEFLTQKNPRLFIGKIEKKINEDQFTINFLRKVVGKKHIYFVFPVVEDKQDVTKNVIKKIVIGQELRRGGYEFSNIISNLSNLE